MLSVFLRQRPGAPVILVGGIHWRILPPCRGLFERRRGRVNSGEFSGICLSFFLFVFPFFRDQSAGGLDSRFGG